MILILKRWCALFKLIMRCNCSKFQSLPWLQNPSIRIFPNVPSTRLTSSLLKSLTILWYGRILCHESIDLINCLNYWWWKCHFNWLYCLFYRSFVFMMGVMCELPRFFWITNYDFCSVFFGLATAPNGVRRWWYKCWCGVHSLVRQGSALVASSCTVEHGRNSTRINLVLDGIFQARVFLFFGWDFWTSYWVGSLKLTLLQPPKQIIKRSTVVCW